MAKIDTKIANTNTAISNYECLKKVHNARENIDKVIFPTIISQNFL